MNQKLFLAFVLAAATATTALAQPAETRTEIISAAPALAEDARPELAGVLPQSRLIGKTRLTVWGFQVYDAKLWAQAGFKPEGFGTQPFALELAYLRDFASKDIAERSITEMRRSATVSDEQAAAWITQMQRVIPNIKKGDRIMGVHRPGTGATFLVNGKAAGDIRDAEFARLFFGIWLSTKTSEPKMRSALIAGAN